MKHLISALVVVLSWVPSALAAEDFNAALRRESAEYLQRQQQATDELNRVRNRIAAEKVPLLQQIRVAEDRLIQAQTDARRTEIGAEHFAEQRRNLIRQIDDLAKSSSYAATLVHDALRALDDGLAPGESQFASDELKQAMGKIDQAAPGHRAQDAMTGAEALATYVERAIGGYAANGRSLITGDNQLMEGTFLFVGPETFFHSATGNRGGSVRMRDGSEYPVTIPIPGWTATEAGALFAHGTGNIPLDASGGKALRLAETKGTVWAHIQKGGAVAFAIVAVGLMAFAMILQKVIELRQMSVAPPNQVQPFFATIAAGDIAEAERLLGTFRGCTAQLFTAGLQQRQADKDVVEEVLESVLLEQRLHFERRLPLLAVIATAAPLMGLLGTVVGMVRTFALITVFGTGNAGKLSSGISEVLVATELGLLVAIPTLVAHGFLAHRIQKNLSTLERYALQLVTAIARARTGSEARTSGIQSVA